MNKGNRKQLRVAVLQYGSIWLNDEDDINMTNDEILDLATENFTKIFSPDYTQIFIDNERKDYWWGYYDDYKEDFSIEDLAIMNRPYEMMLLNKELQKEDNEYYSARYCCHTIKDYMEG